jgi:hypothetical protein
MFYETEIHATKNRNAPFLVNAQFLSQLFWPSIEQTFRIPSNHIVTLRSLQSAIQLFFALEICACRENELFSKRGCPSIVPHLLFGKFLNLEHLFDKNHSPNCAKRIDKRRNCDFSIAVRLRSHERREKMTLPSSSTNLFVNGSFLISDSLRSVLWILRYAGFSASA